MTTTKQQQQQQEHRDVEIGEQTPLLVVSPTRGEAEEEDARQSRTRSQSQPQPSATTPSPVHPSSIVLQDMKAESLKERAVAATAAASFLTSVLSVLFEASVHPIVLVSGMLGMLLSPYAYFQQRKLTQIEALEQTNDAMDAHVSQLERENARLKQSVQQLEESVLNLQAMEETLETLQTLQGRSITELQKQLEDSKQVLHRMDANVTGEILQNLIAVMVATDNDQDFLLSDGEIDQLVEALEATQGVRIRDDLLRRTIVDHGRSLGSLMEVARQLLQTRDTHATGCDHQTDEEGEGAVGGKECIFQFLES